MFLVRMSHQCGIGLDPYFPQRKIGKKYYRYFSAGYFFGGPETANKYDSIEEANNINRKFGDEDECGSIWLGHCFRSEVVTYEQALLDEKL